MNGWFIAFAVIMIFFQVASIVIEEKTDVRWLATAFCIFLHWLLWMGGFYGTPV